DKPLPPARARGFTPHRTADPEHTPIATPPLEPRPAEGRPTPAQVAAQAMAGRATPSRPTPSARDWPIPGASQSTMRGPAPAPTARRSSQPLAMGGNNAPHAPGQAQAQARAR